MTPLPLKPYILVDRRTGGTTRVEAPDSHNALHQYLEAGHDRDDLPHIAVVECYGQERK